MNGAPSIHSVLEIISIDEVKTHLDDYLSRDFNSFEAPMEQQPPAQSVAGRVALKRAICKLAAAHFALPNLTPRDITIRTTPEGAPSIAHIDAGSVGGNAASATVLTSNIFVSISHSRTSAAGLAVVSPECRI